LGIGKALLRHLAGLAIARGCGRMDWNVLAWNEPAIGFYKKLGAEVLPDWRTCRVTGDALEALARR
jgi:ribosomal protein S18 acetylase RimI-like enzyme